MTKDEQSVLIREYLSPRAMAIVGASNARDKFGNLACRELKARGLRVFLVNPHENEICGERCYHTINEIGDLTDRLLIVLPPDVTQKLVRDLNPEFVSYVWMQNGAESAEAIRICNAKGIKTIYGQCILMHAHSLSGHIIFFTGGGQCPSMLNSAWSGCIARESHDATYGGAFLC